MMTPASVVRIYPILSYQYRFSVVIRLRYDYVKYDIILVYSYPVDLTVITYLPSPNTTITYLKVCRLCFVSFLSYDKDFTNADERT